MIPSRRSAVRRSICIAFGLTSLAAAGAAVAEPGYTDGITVYGHRGPYRVPDSVTELSAPVGYADLDLTSPAGRAELDWRIGETAQDLCDRLGEGEERGRNTSVLPSCQTSARQSARSQVRKAVDAQYWAASHYVPPPVYATPAPVYCCATQYAPAPTTVTTEYYSAPTVTTTYWSEPQYYATPTVTTQYTTEQRTWSSTPYYRSYGH